MKHNFKKVLALLLSVMLAFSATVLPIGTLAAEKNESKKYKEGEVIVVLKENASGNYLLSSRVGTSYGKGMKLKNTYSFGKRSSVRVAVLKSSSLTTKQMLKKLKSNAAVKYAFPNYKKHITSVTNDTYSDFQWALDNHGNTDGTVDADVNAEGLWAKVQPSDKTPIVAVCDTGIDLESPEFEGVLWDNPYGSKLLGEHGYDFSGTWEDGRPQDDNGHGTHCAGIIAAKADNGTGISGINKSGVKIMALKWLDSDGSGWTEGVLGTYDYINRAMDLGANIVAVSNSWGGYGDASEMALYNDIYDGFGERGAVSVLAAGNESTDISEGIEEDEMYYTVPACSTSPYALTVAATNEKDELADFSNWSKELVDISAPGVDILSTVSYDCFNPTIYSAEKRTALVGSFQDYNGTVAESDFGYPVVKPISIDGLDCSENASVAMNDVHFGKAGKSISVVTDDELKKTEYRVYCFEIPFTVEDETKPYSVSFMFNGYQGSYAQVYDVPATVTTDDVMDNMVYGIVGGSETGNYWDHIFFNSNTKTEEGEPTDDTYVQAKERKLVFVMEAYAKGTKMTIDDLAVSKCGVDTAEFERYDFYCGTSMATPYVAGAIALIRNCYPDADVRDIINMVKNTGREVEALKDKTETGRVLSLENVEKYPPMIFGAAYNEEGAIEIDGSFKDTTSVKFNGTVVTPTKSDAHLIVVPDKGYSTKKNTIEVTNVNGTATYSTLLSNKKEYPLADDIYGAPSATSSGYMLPAGEKAYYVSPEGSVGTLYYDGLGYFYDEHSMVDFSSLYTNLKDSELGTGMSISAAAVYGDKIYVAAVHSVVASNGTVIGFDTSFGCYDPFADTTEYLCELPDEGIIGASLAAYNGSIYLIGGAYEGKLSDTVYKYNASKKKFEKLSVKLPEARAYTKYIQYGDKLVGVYGAVESGKMPSPVVFDGTKFTTSKVTFDSDDYYEYWLDNGKIINCYEGNVGYAEQGVFMCGVYVYGKGDTLYYDVKNDKVGASGYSTKNSLDGTQLVGTTLPGCFIGFPVSDEEIDDDEYAVGIKARIKNEDVAPDYDEPVDIDPGMDISGITAYKLKLKDGYACVDTDSLNHAYVDRYLATRYNYGDKVTVTLKAEKGYEITSISLNGKELVKGKNSASFIVKEKNNKITATVIKVAPDKVTKLKAKVNAKKKTAKLTWARPKRASGYQVQKLVKGKWKTVKTIKSAATKTYTAKKLAKGTSKFRVRAYRDYKGKRLYGAWSKTVKATIKK